MRGSYGVAAGNAFIIQMCGAGWHNTFTSTRPCVHECTAALKRNSNHSQQEVNIPWLLQTGLILLEFYFEMLLWDVQGSSFITGCIKLQNNEGVSPAELIQLPFIAP